MTAVYEYLPIRIIGLQYIYITFGFLDIMWHRLRDWFDCRVSRCVFMAETPVAFTYVWFISCLQKFLCFSTSNHTFAHEI